MRLFQARGLVADAHSEIPFARLHERPVRSPMSRAFLDESHVGIVPSFDAAIANRRHEGGRSRQQDAAL